MLPIIFLLPLFTMFILQLLPLFAVNLQKLLVLISSIFWQLCCMLLIWQFNSSGYFYQIICVTDFYWITSSLVLAVDSVSIYLIFLTTLLTPICVIALSVKSLSSIKTSLSLVLLLNFCMITCLLVQDILLFYIFFEISLIPLFILILIAGSGHKFVLAAYKLFLYTFISSILMLLNILLIFTETGSLNYIELIEYGWSINKQKILWVAFTIVFLVKLPVVPFHHWLPLAHVSAPTVGSVLLAGIVLKLGAYGLIKFSFVLFYNAWLYFNPFIIVLGLFSLIYSSLVTLYQLDLKTIIAYSSIAHMSTVLLSLSTNLFGCLNVVNFMLITHGLVSPALFLLVGFIYDRLHTKWVNYLVGFGSNMPYWVTFFFLFTLANCAIPLTANFIAEYLTIVYLNSISFVIAFFACFCLILPTLYGFWTYTRILSGLSRLATIADLNRVEFQLLIPLIVNTFMLGLFPAVLLNSVLVYDAYIVCL